MAESSLDSDTGLRLELQKLIEAYRLPAMAITIIKDNVQHCSAAVGIRKIGSKHTVSTSDKWHLGSCGKAITATLLALLIEEGRLNWDTSLKSFFENYGLSIHDDWQSATVWQLLTHSSGVPADKSDKSLWQKPWLSSAGMSASDTRLELVRQTLARPPVHQPGRQYVYANRGYVIAGVMAELITGETFETLIQHRVFQPLEMNDSGFGAPPGHQPWGHIDNIRPISPASHEADTPISVAPAGRMYATMSDWSKFIIAHLEGEMGSSRLLSPRSYKQLHTAGPANNEKYGAGWFVYDREWADGMALMHVGSNLRWFSGAWLAPKRGFAVLITSNTSVNYALEPAQLILNKIIKTLAS